MGEIFHGKSCQAYIIMSQALAKSTPNTILRPAAPLSYKSLQHVIIEYGRWIILKHALRRRAPYCDGKEEDLQKQIYDRRVISSEDLDFFYQQISHYP